MNKNEITKRDDVQQLSSIEKPNRELSNTTSKGTIIIEGMYGTIRFERRLLHTKEIVWKAITEQKEIFRWLPDYKGTFEGYKGGTIDLINTVSGSHVTGKVLVFDLYHLFEHEWHILPNQMFPKGEPESVIKWDLKKADESDTLLTVTHSKLTKSTALTFAPGWHAYLDRLEAILDNQVPPNWAHRFAEVKELYSTR
jgi:uncharacterized protein YndB with AHSA1/START domain